MRTTDKPFSIDKKRVYEAYKAVKSNAGAAGVDGQTIEQFEADLQGNSIRRLTRSRTALAQSSRTYRARFRLASVAPTKSRSTTSSSTMPTPGLHLTWNHIARRRRRS